MIQAALFLIAFFVFFGFCETIKEVVKHFKS